MVRRMCRGLWPVDPSERGPYRASARMMVVGSPWHTSMREAAASAWWGKWDGWPSRLAVRSTKPQHFDGVADCLVLAGALSPSVRRAGGGVHVADDDRGAKHGHLAVYLGQGLEEGFRGVAEGDVGVDDVELPSVPDDLVDA